jgi:hypothetical protein
MAIGAALLIAGGSNAKPSQSKDIITLADQWLGMPIDQFEKAVQITPSVTIIKSTLVSGQEVTELADFAAPGLKGLEPASLNLMSYSFDAPGHLIEISGTVAQGYTDAMAAHILTSTYGPPVSGSSMLGLSANLWVFNSVAVEISGGFVFIYRFPRYCIDALKGAPPDPKALEGCGRP